MYGLFSVIGDSSQHIFEILLVQNGAIRGCFIQLIGQVGAVLLDIHRGRNCVQRVFLQEGLSLIRTGCDPVGIRDPL